MYIVNYKYGDAHVEADYKKGNRLDKTAFRLVYAASDDPSYASFYQSMDDVVFSSNLLDEEKEYVRTHYLGHRNVAILGFQCLFDSTEPILMLSTNFNYIDESRVRYEFSISPLSANAYLLSEDEETGMKMVSKSYRFTFNDEGLVTRLSVGYSEDSALDYAIANISYSTTI